MSESKTKVALVTGATNGIGRSIAQAFAAEGVNLIIAARGEQELASLAREWSARYGIGVLSVPCDLSRRGGAQRLCDEVGKAEIQIDYLVNNAGSGVFGRFMETDIEDELSINELNMMSPTILCKHFLPQLLRRRGKIMNVASVAAFQPGPYMAVYYATKAYLLSLSEAMNTELKGTGVTVTTFCPGPTQSGFQDAAGMSSSGLVKGKRLPSAHDVGVAGYRALMEGKSLFIPGFMNKVMVGSVRFAPRAWIQRAVMAMSAPR